jgi:type IV secretion system protein VirB9
MRPTHCLALKAASALLSGLTLLVAIPTGAETLPSKGQVDSRIRTALYSADEVYRLFGFVGYDIELIFEAGEHFTGQGGGDLEAMTIKAYENYVHIKPRAAVVATNVVIYTTRRAYRFDYSASARKPSRFMDEVMYAVRFTYPQMSAADPRISAAQRLEDDLARAKVNRPRNTDYWFCGHRAVKPVAASDDGVHTRITFGTRAEIPAIFVSNDDGAESLLNFSMEDGDMVIHRVAPRFIIRRGKLTGCIVNKGYRGAGQRLESGTISPSVERAVKDAEP